MYLFRDLYQMLFVASKAFLKYARHLFVVLGLLSFSSYAAVSNSVAPQSIAKPIVGQFNLESLRQSIADSIGLTVIKASPSALPGIAEVITDQGLFYVTFDGKHLIQGTVFSLDNDAVSNLTEVTMSEMRLEGLAQFEKDMIVYKAEDEKHVISVFTDITCGYCRQMHEKIDEYNDLGITVRYLAYPREGVMDRAGRFTKGFQDLRSIWCHEDPQTALTKAKAGMGVAQRICKKPVAEEFNFARQVGINSTPSIIFENGDLRPGFIPPETLIQLLDNM